MKRARIKLGFCVLVVFGCLAPAGLSAGSAREGGAVRAGQEARSLPPAKAYDIHPATSPVKVDGVLDEPAWAAATVIDLPYEWTPGDNIPAPVKTECLVTFSRTHFLAAFRCFDPDPSKIRAHYMDRDNTDTLIQDDHVVIMLDPFNDERRGFQFRVNPLGVQAEANFSELEGYEDFSWDAIWASAGKITDWGYAIEISIPFNQLRFPRTSGPQTWGFSAERSYPRNVRYRMTSHVRSRNVTCILCQMNKVTGFQDITPGLNLELDPTLTADRTDTRPDFPSGPMEAGPTRVKPGLTVRWGVTPNLMLNGAANPDFSQVEADVAQLEVNTRFALYYPEKRPFFLEGADFFLTPIMAVFTRTVADPAGGLKLTGKFGRNAIGFFGAYDRINNLVFPSNQDSLSGSDDQDTLSGVLRYRRDVGKGSTIGALYAGRTAEGYHNHVAGVDTFLRLSPTKTLSVQYLHSDTRYPGPMALSFGQKRDAFGGDAFQVQFFHQDRRWLYQLSYQDYSPGFRADSGYVPRVDLRLADAALYRQFWGEQNHWYTRLFMGLEAELGYDHSGNLTDQTLFLSLLYAGPWQSQINLLAGPVKELYQGVLYNQVRMMAIAESKPAGGLRLGLSASVGDGIDYTNARPAKRLRLVPSGEFGLGRHLNLNFTYIFENLRFQGSRIYQAHLPQLRVVYNFNVRVFVRAIVQYTALRRNLALYVVPVPERTDTVFTQFLFSYKINPQTVLFLGYSDNYLGAEGIDITRTDRTFFFKVGYAWLR
jgi:hypothetical protein